MCGYYAVTMLLYPLVGPLLRHSASPPTTITTSLSLSQSLAFRQSQPPPGHPPFSTTLRTSLFLFLWHTGHRDPRIIPPSFLVLSLFTAVQPRDAHVGRAGQDRPASEKARRAGPCSARSAVRMADSQWQIVSAGRGSAIGVAYVVAETENH